MQIELRQDLIQQLERIAAEQGRGIDEVVEDMIDTYQRRSDREQFRAEVRQVIEKHAELLDKLAKR